MSPAPTRTGSPDGEAAGDADEVATAWLGAITVGRVPVARGVARGAPSRPPDDADHPEQQDQGGAERDRSEPHDRAIERGPGRRGASLIGESLPLRLGHGRESPFEAPEAAFRNSRSKFPAA